MSKVNIKYSLKSKDGLYEFSGKGIKYNSNSPLVVKESKMVKKSLIMIMV